MLVGPVRVVDEQGERNDLGEPSAQPVEAVEAREEALVGRRAVGDVLEQRASQPGRAGEQLLAHGGAERLDARRQQLYHQAESELSLHELPRARSTTMPRSSASAAASSISVLLPIPAAP